VQNGWRRHLRVQQLGLDSMEVRGWKRRPDPTRDRVSADRSSTSMVPLDPCIRSVFPATALCPFLMLGPCELAGGPSDDHEISFPSSNGSFVSQVLLQVPDSMRSRCRRSYFTMRAAREVDFHVILTE
jgi:hypothetical protein